MLLLADPAGAGLIVRDVRETGSLRHDRRSQWWLAACYLPFTPLGGSATQAKPAAGSDSPAPLYWGAWIGNQLTGTAAPWDMARGQRVRADRRQGALADRVRRPARRTATHPPAPS